MNGDLSNILKISDPEILLATQFKKKRHHNSEIITTLFGLNYELSRIIPMSNNYEIKRLKYKWWSNIIQDITTGKQVSNNHYLLNSLINIISKYNLSYEDFDIIFATREFDIHESKLKNATELENYIDNYLYQIYFIYQKANNIILSESEQETIKQICYISKILKILLGLKKYNYNEHPFVTSEMVKKLQNHSAIKRQDALYDILKEYLSTKYHSVQNSAKISDILLENIRMLILMQAKKCLKTNFLSNMSILDYKELRWRFRLRKIVRK